MDFLQTVKQIGIFMICAQAILHFKPSAKYEKYIKLLISVMVLVQLLVPVVELVTGNNRTVFFTRLEEIQTGIEEEMEQLEIENAVNEENVLQETKQEIRNRVKEIAQQVGLVVSAVEFRETYLAVYVAEERNAIADIPDVEIEPITVGETKEPGDAIETMSENTTEHTAISKEKLHMLRNEISKQLGIEENRIEVLEDESGL